MGLGGVGSEGGGGGFGLGGGQGGCEQRIEVFWGEGGSGQIIIIIIIIIIMSLFYEDNIFSKYANLTYGPLKTKNTNST